MKSIKIAGLCLVVMFSMSMVAAGSASAAGPVWEECSEGGSSTKYETAQCEKASGTGNFEWNEIKTTEAVIIVGLTLTLRDAGIGTAVRCTTESEGAGVVGPGKRGVITTAEVKEAKSCTVLEGGCKAGEVEAVKGVDLPWDTELFETENAVETKIESSGHGEPGWEVKCNTALGKTTDTCTEEEKRAEVDSLRRLRSRRPSGRIGSLSSGRYLERRRSKCSLGGAEEGELKYETATELKKEAGLGA